VSTSGALQRIRRIRRINRTSSQSRTAHLISSQRDAAPVSFSFRQPPSASRTEVYPHSSTIKPRRLHLPLQLPRTASHSRQPTRLSHITHPLGCDSDSFTTDDEREASHIDSQRANTTAHTAPASHPEHNPPKATAKALTRTEENANLIPTIASNKTSSSTTTTPALQAQQAHPRSLRIER
jgi:hypothetical protein